MTVKEALAECGLHRRDGERLLAHVLQLSPAALFARPDATLSAGQYEAFAHGCKRLSAGEPVEYITESATFCGRQFHVDRHVLIPRPATELLVHEALKLLRLREANAPWVTTVDEGIAAVCWRRSAEAPHMLVDACTGSGCIGITIALEVPTLRVCCSDASADAVAVAAMNVRRHGCADRVRLACEADLPQLLIDGTYLLVANPPYIPENAWVQDSVRRWEPHEALFAGSTGVDVLLPIVRSAAEDVRCLGIAMECRQDQVQAVLNLLLPTA